MSVVTALSGLVRDNIWQHDDHRNRFGPTKHKKVDMVVQVLCSIMKQITTLTSIFIQLYIPQWF